MSLIKVEQKKISLTLIKRVYLVQMVYGFWIMIECLKELCLFLWKIVSLMLILTLLILHKQML